MNENITIMKSTLKRWSTTECAYKQLDKIQLNTQSHDPATAATLVRIFPTASLKNGLNTPFSQENSERISEGLSTYIHRRRIQSTGATSSWCPLFIQSSGSIRYRPRPV